MTVFKWLLPMMRASARAHLKAGVKKAHRLRAAAVPGQITGIVEKSRAATFDTEGQR
jgi:hypothetical protein